MTTPGRHRRQTAHRRQAEERLADIAPRVSTLDHQLKVAELLDPFAGAS